MIIAEIGNAHFGEFKRAKELIKAAHESGADLIKGQAFRAEDIKSGSMSKAFYKKCAFGISEYIELIEYARFIGNDLFYSIFSPGMERISLHQKWHKLAGAQTKAGRANETWDIGNVIISVPASVNIETLYPFKAAEILYVTDYLPKDPSLDNIPRMAQWLGRTVGYSDHTLGIENCVKAWEYHGSTIIEKHFCMKKEEAFGTDIFRDTVHGSTPEEFEKLCKIINME